MKKIISLGITLLSVIALSACNSGNSEKSVSNSKTKAVVNTLSKSSDAHKSPSGKSDDSSNFQGSSQSSENEIQASDSTSSASSQTVAISNDSNSVATNGASGSSSAVNSTTSTAQELVGHSYGIEPIMYDGEESGQAMKDNKAPQNLITDYSILLRFDSTSSATTRHFALHSRPTYLGYSINDNTINIVDLNVANFKIPFTNNGNSISFGTWTTTLSDGHTITWQIRTIDGREFN